VLDTAGQQPVPGAQVTPSWDLAPVTTGADGSYSLGALASPPANPFKLTVSAPGFITREVWVGWIFGVRNDVTLDVIRDAPPFSMDFYQQMVRGMYDQPGAPWTVLRLATSPKFYVRTVDQDGRAIEPEVLDVVRDALQRGVPAFTAGKLTAAAIESGTDVRPDASGWINVDILRTSDSDAFACGTAFIGANPGRITLYDDVCNCGSRKIPGETVMHEVGHAMGFFHVSDRKSLMYPTVSGYCPVGDLSPAEKYHSAIAYSRPRGNTEPDNDPSTSKFLNAGPRARVLVIN